MKRVSNLKFGYSEEWDGKVVCQLLVFGFCPLNLDDTAVRFASAQTRLQSSLKSNHSQRDIDRQERNLRHVPVADFGRGL